ncbi:MAG: hypothetical protein H6581_17805 [Bacteroidia bacterium]|nr:hypothetical protein [Bacteroidia bacterium]
MSNQQSSPIGDPGFVAKKLESRMALLAKSLGLSYLPGDYRPMHLRHPQIGGLYKGRKLRLDLGQAMNGTPDPQATQVSLNIKNPGRFRVRIQKAPVFYGIEKAFNARDFSTGDAKFDRAHRITSPDHQLLDWILNLEARELISQIWLKTGGTGDLELKKNWIYYTEPFALNSPTRMENVIHLMTLLADRLEEYSFFGDRETGQTGSEDEVF